MHVLQLPDHMVAPCHTIWTGMEGLLVLLRRLAHPDRLSSVVVQFSRSRTSLSYVQCYPNFASVQKGCLLTDSLARPYFSQAKVRDYRAAFRQKTGD